ncbi:peptidase domain-containing ABC transporter [Streptantibioticus parmotrematis]|uniref:peptidase domain-containing ABC transporter n=1 Tax=Streptantibioticus parmotrematis TaxID=2873249 RepID=UPI0033C32126
MLKWSRYHARQHGETDCGPASAHVVLRRHGIFVDTAILRESVGLGHDGSSMQRLRDVLSSYGVDSELFRLSIRELAVALSLAGPAIILLDQGDGGHFVVVHETMQDGSFIISDPLEYRPRRVNPTELSSAFQGKCLVTECVPARSTHTRPFAPPRLLWDVVRSRRRAMAAVLGLSALVSGVALLTGMFLQFAMDFASNGDQPGSLGVLACGFVLAIAAAAGMQYARGRLLVRLGQSVQRQLSEQYLKKLFGLPSAFHQSRRTGDLVSRLDDIQQIQSLVATTTIQATLDVFVMALVGTTLIWLSPLIFLILLVPATVNVVSSSYFYREIRETAEEALQRDSTLKAEAFNTLQHIEEIASYGKRQFALSRVSRALDRRVRSETRLGRLENINGVVKMANMGIFSILIGWVGLTRVRTGSMSIGQLFSYFTLAGYFISSMESITSIQVTVQRTAAALGRYRDVISQKDEERSALAHPGHQGGSTAVSQPRRGGRIDVRELTFSYRGSAKAAVTVPRLFIPAGSSTLIKGGNGCGKSTLLKVVAGLYSGYTGSVELNGTQVSELNETALQGAVLYVPETPLVIDGSVHENLTLGSPYSEQEIVGACHTAGFLDVVQEMPRGFDQTLRERGTGLSRGQLQRMSLARALLNNPDIYLFDESFSGIDPETTERIWDDLRGVNATKVVVAHGPTLHMDFDVEINLDEDFAPPTRSGVLQVTRK